VNYQIHTDAIKQNLIPVKLSKQQIAFVYANEADLLNMALFGKTAKQWRDETSAGSATKPKGNIRDEASIEQLVVLTNLESINAMLIKQNLSQAERLLQLNEMAITQMKSLVNRQNTIKRIK
jgi:hypothetical protein